MKALHRWMLFWSLLFSAAVRSETVYLTSLYWPPYSGYSLPQQGATVQVVREASCSCRIMVPVWGSTLTGNCYCYICQSVL